MLLVNTFAMLLSKLQLKTALLVNKYFYNLLIVLNVIGWFIIFMLVFTIFLARRKWPVTKDDVLNEIQG
jgi:hypothetical protein